MKFFPHCGRYTHHRNFTLRALDLRERYDFSFYDSLIVAAALEAGCTRLYSEDMQHGQQIRHLTIYNPFVDESQSAPLQLERHTRRINNPQHRLLAELPLVPLCSPRQAAAPRPNSALPESAPSSTAPRTIPPSESRHCPSRIEHRQPIRKARCNRIRQKRPVTPHHSPPSASPIFHPKKSRYSSYRSLPSGQGISAGDGAHAANAKHSNHQNSRHPQALHRATSPINPFTMRMHHPRYPAVVNIDTQQG